MKGKKLSIEELERLPIGSRVIVEDNVIFNAIGNGIFEHVPTGLRYPTKVIYDSYNHNIYQYSEIQQQSSYNNWFNIGVDFSKEYIDEFKKGSWEDISYSNFITYDQKSYKPESRITREFNIAKKKEYEVLKRSKEKRLKYIVACVEINIDKALEQMNKDRFIMLTNKLKELRKVCEVI